MRKLILFLLFPAWLMATNITFYVNGSASNSMVQGDEVSWYIEANNPGATVDIHIYKDVNANQSLDAGDRLLDFFAMMDNDPNPDGPGDTDGLTNGILDVQFGTLGFVDGDFIFEVVDEDGTTVTAPFHVEPMNSNDVQLTVVGDISMEGITAPNSILEGIIFGVFTESGIFMGQTDINGHFVININIQVTDGEFDQIFQFSSPANYVSNYDGIAFSFSGNSYNVGTIPFTSTNLRVYGTVTDNDNVPLNKYLYIGCYNDDNSVENEWYVKPDGTFEVYLNITQPETLHLNLDMDDLAQLGYMAPDAWALSSPYRFTVDAASNEKVVNVYLYQANSSITVELTGGEADSSYQFDASNNEIFAVSRGYTDPATGIATIAVTDVVPNYWVYFNDFETQAPPGMEIRPLGGGQSVDVGGTAYFSFVDPTGIRDNSGKAEVYALNQNYPNPFNPETEISFSLAKAGTVSLVIYNSLGQKVATLLNNASYSKGSHQVKFDASNLPSGLYLYQLKADDYTATRKMVLMK